MVNTNAFLEANWHRKNKHICQPQQWYQSKILGKPLRRMSQSEFAQRHIKREKEERIVNEDMERHHVVHTIFLIVICYVAVSHQMPDASFVCDPSLDFENILFELDLTNNRFAGKFPHFVLELPELKYLDIRFNEFEGEFPRQLFNKNLDAILVNHSRFSSSLPENIGNSPALVIVLANNKFSGCVPSSITKMTQTLDELVLIHNGFNSCLPETIGLLKNLSVLDLSYNRIKGELPSSIGEMTSLEVLNVAHNMLSGKIPESLCLLPNLDSFNYEYNFLVNQTDSCLELAGFDDRRNCFKDRPEQRTRTQCGKYLSKIAV
ncbi:leucine-rich repeat extensin-like protein 4 [Tanacetum coccineum]